MNENIEKDTGRIEALSDGIFGVAITLLAIELKIPTLKTISNHGLASALLENWPEYLTIVNSFASILLMWVSHHNLFKMIKKPKMPFIAVNGMLLLFVTLTIFSTKTLSFYILTDAAKVAAAFYGFTCMMISGSFCLLWYKALNDKEQLVENIPEITIRAQSISYVSGFAIYFFATLLAFVSPWLTVGIVTVSWLYWVLSFKKTE